MNIDQIEAIALQCLEDRDFTALDEAMCAAVPGADAAQIWAMLTVEGNHAVHSDAELPTRVVAAIVDRGLQLSDPQVLGTAVRMSHFHCAALVAGDIRKAQGQRALADAQSRLRAAWDSGTPQLRATIAHALAAAEVTTPDDVARVGELLDSDDPEVRALAMMVHAVIGGPQRDDALTQYLDDSSPLVRMMAAISLAREGGVRPLSGATIDALRDAYQNPPALPAWWVFQWIDGPETSQDLAERMLEAADVPVTPPTAAPS